MRPELLDQTKGQFSMVSCLWQWPTADVEKMYRKHWNYEVVEDLGISIYILINPSLRGVVLLGFQTYRLPLGCWAQ